MKRIILLALSLLLGIGSYAQTEWETQPSTLKINVSNSLDISNVSSNSVTLHNGIAESKENKKQNRITARNGILPLYVNGTSKRISFNIEDINNDPSHYKYPVQNANGKTEYTQDIYWGITVYMAGVDGKEYNIQYTFLNRGAKGGNYGLVDTSRPSSQSFCISGYTKNSGTFAAEYNSCYGLPSQVEIILQDDNVCCIQFDDYSITAATVGSIDGVRRVEFNLYAGAKIRVYNLKVERKSIYSKVSSFITAGDSRMSDGGYSQAASEYSKAIDKGYKNYDIYFKRANAYFASEFYNNAIDDCTKAISYKSTTDAYLLRGKAKLLKSDMSGVDDLRKGGSEGMALVRELELDKATDYNSHPMKAGSQKPDIGNDMNINKNESGIIINNPNVQLPTHPRDIISIKSIERRTSITVVNFGYTNPHDYGGWVSISPSTYIRTSTAQYKIIDAVGIPYAPNMHTFTKIGEKLWFSLVFPAINEDIETIDLIEDINSTSAFNFYGVALTQPYTSTLKSENQQGKSDQRQSSTQNNIRQSKQLIKDNNFKVE